MVLSLHGQPSASEGIPTFNTGMSAPSIQVGGGGKGQPPSQSPPDLQKTMSETVGETAEKTSEVTASSSSVIDQNHQGTTLREREPDERPNPKKRMWEERPAAKQEDHLRDEL